MRNGSPVSASMTRPEMIWAGWSAAFTTRSPAASSIWNFNHLASESLVDDAKLDLTAAADAADRRTVRPSRSSPASARPGVVVHELPGKARAFGAASQSIGLFRVQDEADGGSRRRIRRHLGRAGPVTSSSRPRMSCSGWSATSAEGSSASGSILVQPTP